MTTSLGCCFNCIICGVAIKLLVEMKHIYLSTSGFEGVALRSIVPEQLLVNYVLPKATLWEHSTRKIRHFKICLVHHISRKNCIMISIYCWCIVSDVILNGKGHNSVEQNVTSARYYRFIPGVVNQWISKDLSCDALKYHMVSLDEYVISLYQQKLL